MGRVAIGSDRFEAIGRAGLGAHQARLRTSGNCFRWGEARDRSGPARSETLANKLAKLRAQHQRASTKEGV